VITCTTAIGARRILVVEVALSAASLSRPCANSDRARPNAVAEIAAVQIEDLATGTMERLGYRDARSEPHAEDRFSPCECAIDSGPTVVSSAVCAPIRAPTPAAWPHRQPRRG